MIKTGGQNRDNSIVIARLLATFMLLLGHLCQYYEWTVMPQLLPCVRMFLIISGYLHGKRESANIKAFYKKKLISCLVPVWVFSAFVFAYSSLAEKVFPTVTDVVVHLLNLQGINNICTFIPYYYFSSCAILWFMTPIMFCYLLTPLLSKIEEKWSMRRKIVILVFTFILPVFKIQSYYFLTYAIGFAIARHDIKMSKATFARYTIYLLVIIIVRFACHFIIDGTVLYDWYILQICQIAMVVYILLFVRFAYENDKRMFDDICTSKIVRWIDSRQMAIYITHYLFFKGFWDVRQYFGNNIVRTIALLIFTIPAAEIFQFICNKIQRKITHD